MVGTAVTRGGGGGGGHSVVGRAVTLVEKLH